MRKRVEVTPSPEDLVRALGGWLDERGGWLWQLVHGEREIDEDGLASYVLPAEEIEQLAEDLMRVGLALPETANRIAAESRPVQRRKPFSVIEGGKA